MEICWYLFPAWMLYVALSCFVKSTSLFLCSLTASQRKKKKQTNSYSHYIFIIAWRNRSAKMKSSNINSYQTYSIIPTCLALGWWSPLQFCTHHVRLLYFKNYSFKQSDHLYFMHPRERHGAEKSSYEILQKHGEILRTSCLVFIWTVCSSQTVPTRKRSWMNSLAWKYSVKESCRKEHITQVMVRGCFMSCVSSLQMHLTYMTYAYSRLLISCL